MYRREFIGSLIASAVYVRDPERALWVPGKKLISIPIIPKPVTFSKRAVIHSADGRWMVDVEYTTDPVITVRLTGISIKAAETFRATLLTGTNWYLPE